MKETLASLFKPYHPLGPIVAHRNVRMRGQAFVSFRDKATAALAQKDVNEFPLYGKPIVSKPSALLYYWPSPISIVKRHASTWFQRGS